MLFFWGMFACTLNNEEHALLDRLTEETVLDVRDTPTAREVVLDKGMAILVLEDERPLYQIGYGALHRQLNEVDCQAGGCTMSGGVMTADGCQLFYVAHAARGTGRTFLRCEDALMDESY